MVLYAIAIVNIPTYGRLVRAKVLSLKSEEYITAARAIGMKNGRQAVQPHPAEQPDADHCSNHSWRRDSHH